MAQEPTTDDNACLLRFNELKYDTIHEIKPFLPLSGSRSCDYSIGGIYMWIDCFKYHYCIYENTLFLKGVMEDDTAKVAFSLPLGHMPLEKSIGLLRKYCECSGNKLEFSAIPGERIDEFRALNPSSITSLDHWADYVYDIHQMATFSGKKMSKKRNHVNHFMGLYPEAVSEPIGPDNLNAVKRCFEEVCSTPPDSAMANYERQQVWHVLDNLPYYGFESLCLRVGDEVAAFTLGEVVGDTLQDHIEKALRRYEGSGETLFRNFSAATLTKYPQLQYVNREDDAGDEGLRQSKLSYNPALMVDKYNVIFDK